MKKIIQCSMLLSLIIILFNCQKDDDPITQEVQQTNSNITFTTIHAKAIANNKALKTILEKQEIKQREAKTSKTVYNAQYNFTINTDYAKVIEHDGLKRYTFGVTRTEDNGLLENLLLKEQTDGTFKVYLVQYDVTAQERSTLANQEIVDVDNKISYLPLEDISSSIFSKVNSNAETCTVYSYVWQDGNLCSANGNHSYQDGGYSESNPGGCHAWGNPDLMATSGGYVLTSNEQECGSGSTSGYEPDDNTTTTNNTTNSNGSGYYYTPTPDTEVILCPGCPVIDEECSATDALNSLASTLGLDTALVTCLSDEEKCGAVGELNTFLQHNPSEIVFAKAAAKAICNDSDVDFNKKIINGIKINSNVPPCLENMILDLMLGNYPYSSTMGDIELINDVFETLAIGNPNGIDFVTEYKIGNINGNGMTNVDYNGSTNQFEATITIGNNLINNGTKLAIIKTILHESIHSYLLYLRQQYPIYFNLGDEFSDLVTSFQNYTNDNDPHHIYMANLVEIMAANVKSFVIEKYEYPASTDEYYQAVCWSGLTHLTSSSLNPVFIQNFPNFNDQQHVIKIFNTENGTNNYSGYTPLINNNCN